MSTEPAGEQPASTRTLDNTPQPRPDKEDLASDQANGTYVDACFTTTPCDQRLCSDGAPPMFKYENTTVSALATNNNIYTASSILNNKSNSSHAAAQVEAASDSASTTTVDTGVQCSSDVVAQVNGNGVESSSSTPVASSLAASPVSSSDWSQKTAPTSTTTSTTKATTATANGTSTTSTGTTTAPIQPKRLHVSNIPFRFRDPDLRSLFGVSVHERSVMRAFIAPRVR